MLRPQNDECHVINFAKECKKEPNKISARLHSLTYKYRFH